jgi:hypothetical protein
MDVERAHFWRGPIVERAQATRIVRYTGGAFAVLGAACAVAAVVERFQITLWLFGALPGLPALALLVTKRAIAAWVLFAIGLISLAMTVGTTATMLRMGTGWWVIFVAPIFLYWILAAYLGFRAAKAARYLRAHPTVGDAFD